MPTEIDSDGNKYWKNDKRQYHRTDGPAIEYADGSKSWYVEGKRHRTDGPAIEYANGDKSWYVEGKLHRTDGPAIEFADGDKYWYVENKRHRTDGPACEYADGSKSWYVEGKGYTEEKFLKKVKPVSVEKVFEEKLVKDSKPTEIDSVGNKYWKNDKGQYHRTDGPAIEYANGDKSWYVEGKEYTEEKFLKKVKPVSVEKVFEEKLVKDSKPTEIDSDGNKYWKNDKGQYHRTDGPAIEYANGDKSWYVEGKLHRTDGPACECADGSKSWYVENKRHRTDGPACECANGDKYWYVEGKLHRTDGPAIEYANGSKSWYVEGKGYTEEKFLKKVKPVSVEKVFEEKLVKDSKPTEIDSVGNKYWKNDKGQYHRTDGPACEYADGSKSWYVEGKRHRTDGPACECADGSKSWYVEGKLHRTDGPACECADGSKYWFVEEKLHRTDGPAIEYADGSKSWYVEGKGYTEEKFLKKVKPVSVEKVFEEKLVKDSKPTEIDSDGNKRWKNDKGQYHRTDGPAIEYADGSKSWYVEGKLHRTDGPAIEYANGSKYWFVEEKPHRTDGPAIEYANGDKSWYVEGKLHRTDGPAIEYADGSKSWYVEGKGYTEEKFLKKVKPVSVEKVFEEKLVKDSKPTEIDSDGNKYWKNDKGQYHRTDGPAIEYANGSKYWYVENKRHRTDGPACEFANGDKYWYVEGKLHRTDGPAIEYANGDKEWYVEGKEYTEEEFKKVVTKSVLIETKEEKVQMNTFGDKIKSDAVDASYRVARRQVMNIIRGSIVSMLEKNKTKRAQIRAMGEFLTTPIGEALILGILGTTPEFIPMIKDNKILQKLAAEARIEGMAMVGNFAMDGFVGVALPQIMEVINNISLTENRLRVAETQGALPLEQDEDDEVLNDVKKPLRSVK